jgi:hypothetical protein
MVAADFRVSGTHPSVERVSKAFVEQTGANPV